MTAQDKLKEYFYNHIINHQDFNIEDYEDDNGNVLKLPESFDKLIKMFEDYGTDDWYNEFDIDELEFDTAKNEYYSVIVVFKVEKNVFISLNCELIHYSWEYDFDTCKYVKQVEVTVTQWKEDERS